MCENLNKELGMYNRDELKRQERTKELLIATHERTLMELNKKRTKETALIKKLKIELEKIKYELSKPICNHCHCVINRETYSSDMIDGAFCSKQCLIDEIENRIKCEVISYGGDTNNYQSNVRVVKDADDIDIVGENEDPWYEKIEKKIEELGHGFSSEEVYWLIIKEKGTIRKEDKKKLDLLTYQRIGKILRSLGYVRKTMYRRDCGCYSGWYKALIDGEQDDGWYNIIKNGVVKLGNEFTTKDVYCAIIKKYSSNVCEHMTRQSAIRICRILRCLGYVAHKKTVNGRRGTLWKKI